MLMQIVAWIASLLVFLAFFMKTMIPLRMVAIISNVAFIIYALLGLYYGIFEKVFPIFVLHLSLLPINIIRLYQIKQLIKKIGEASANEPSVEYLIPYMERETYAKGQALFQKGDTADKIYFIQAGGVTIPEVKRELTAGAVFGEVGIFTPLKTRSASAICGADAVIFSIHKDKVLELYYQNPKFGFFIVRLLSSYVSENTDTILEFRNKSMLRS
jgi:CRP/FNR family transcriptional regulator, cyclic AMP receptor protein